MPHKKKKDKARQHHKAKPSAQARTKAHRDLLEAEKLQREAAGDRQAAADALTKAKAWQTATLVGPRLVMLDTRCSNRWAPDIFKSKMTRQAMQPESSDVRTGFPGQSKRRRAGL